jgi:NDP-sugar pyrophosphorylase family protein
VAINLHHRPQEIQDLIGDGDRLGLSVQYLWEPELLGTAGAYRNYCLHFGSQPCWVVYGDNLLSFDLGKMRSAHEQAHVPLTLALFDQATQPHTGIAGGRVVVGPDQRVLSFVEGGDSALSTLVNAGVYRVEPGVLEAVPAQGPYDFARELFPALLASGQPLLGHRIDGYCLGLDTPESLACARELLESGKVVAP